MAQVIVTESSLENIASAIRGKLNTQDTYKPSEMAGAISQIHGDPVLEALTVNANGTYIPSSGKDGFSQAVVNVPNSYSSGDEGKVVSGGALVAQSSQSITQNGTYDTTLKNQVIVNVSGGGGGGASVTTSLYEPQSGVGSDGDIWVQYGEVYPNKDFAASITLTLVIVSALRGTDSLSYAGAAELDVIWADENDNEISMRGQADFSYTRFSNSAFDNNVNSYWEANPTPITATMTATIPAGYKVKSLKVIQRTSSYTSDVWKEFYLKVQNAEIMRYANMSTDDWSGAGEWTIFTPQSVSLYRVVDTWININGEWTSPAQIDVTIV